MTQLIDESIARSTRSGATADRIGAWAGIAFALTFIVYLVVGVANGPRFNEPATELRPFIEDNAGALRFAFFVISFGLIFFLLPFVVIITEYIERTRADVRWLSRVALAAATVSVLVFLISIAVAGAIVLAGADTVSDDTLEAIWRADALLIVSLFHLGTGAWVGATSVAILLSGALPRWLGWLGLVSLVAQVVAATWLFAGEVTAFHDAVAGIGQISAFIIWVPGVAIAMLRRSAASG